MNTYIFNGYAFTLAMSSFIVTTVLDSPPTLSEDRMAELKAYAIKQAKFGLLKEIGNDESLWELKEEIDRFTGRSKITVTLVVLKK